MKRTQMNAPCTWTMVCGLTVQAAGRLGGGWPKGENQDNYNSINNKSLKNEASKTYAQLLFTFCEQVLNCQSFVFWSLRKCGALCSARHCTRAKWSTLEAAAKMDYTDFLKQLQSYQ